MTTKHPIAEALQYWSPPHQNAPITATSANPASQAPPPTLTTSTSELRTEKAWTARLQQAERALKPCPTDPTTGINMSITKSRERLVRLRKRARCRSDSSIGNTNFIQPLILLLRPSLAPTLSATELHKRRSTHKKSISQFE